MPSSLPPQSRQVYSGVLTSVYEWDQQLYDGTITKFETIVRPDTASVIAFLDPMTVLLTKQEQPHKSLPFIAVPGGGVDPGETAENAAKRELLEETGYIAGRIMLWRSNLYTGLVRYEQFIYVATDLVKHPDGLHTDAGEKIELMPTSWKAAVQLSLRQQLRGHDVMLAMLAMYYDPDERARLEQFLSGA